MTLRIGNAAGFLGDQLGAARRLVESATLDYLTLEYLAELTFSILARKRQKDPEQGYAGDFLEVLASLTPALREQPQLKIVTNAGGVNPGACARAAGAVLRQAGLDDVPIGVVTGDDLTDGLDALRAAGCTLANMDDGRPFDEVAQDVVSANAYLGAAPIVEALTGGARIVITGRVADASLTVGPAVFEFGFAWDDFERLAGASVAGHLIECGAQVTGGYRGRWQDLDLANVGYPIAELEAGGDCVITKPEGSGGIVDRATVIEQLVYEIGDPKAYITPDVVVDFSTVRLEEVGPDRVSVSGATGRAAPSDLKASIAYRDGYTAAGTLLVYGHDVVEKARQCAQVVFARVEAASFSLSRTHIECLGAGEAVPGIAAENCTDDPANVREVVLRMSVWDRQREAVERFTKEIAPLITSGPAGLAGYAAGRPTVRQVHGFWPALVPRSRVTPRCEVKTAAEWEASS